MSFDACVALLLDGPMQSWGYSSRFDRRLTALHPTRSGVQGLIAAALGIDKNASDESEKMEPLNELRFTTVKFDRINSRGKPLPIQRLEDYHTVTGIRRASGKIDKKATVQTYRHYLLDARFGVLIEGGLNILEEIATALRNPMWGIWFGRKCCIPATPVLAAPPGKRSEVWNQLLLRSGYDSGLSIEHFDRVIEVSPDATGTDVINDNVIGYGQPIGERHAPRWIHHVPKSKTIDTDS